MILKSLEKIVVALEENDIEYMLSGSLAMNIYTVPRMTRDIDFVINIDPSRITGFLNIFKDGYYLSEETIKSEVTRRGMFNIIDHSDGMKLDFIVRKDTEFREMEFARRIRRDVYGFDIWVVSIEDLIISKLKWIQQLQSDTQMKDIKNLLDSSGIDWEYLTRWVEKLDLNTFGLLDD